ncbi:MAG: 2-C-methyl-D-erythritol 4-phosphate cytidylyltransferase [Desulfatiglans sp.]|jgi:2-C-methyl-D-erythritol 4-phosphate cytidylyltransferase|nr:2-C-methyl-D-erythritol 4-phosphate cytidylyltransferase [Desulfatiglans sp.]
MITIAIIPAAGMGVRMNAKVPKQFIELEGKPLLAITLEKFNSCPLINGIILVVPANEINFCKTEIVMKYNISKVIRVTPGSARRQDSVRLGLQAIDRECDAVIIHDGVRPFVSPDIITNAIEAIRDERAVIVAVPAKDTVKKVNAEGFVVDTYDRKFIWQVQTPQVFRYDDICNAHKKAEAEGWDEVTDDAMLMERMGIPVKVVHGSDENIKITTPQDLEYAEFLLGKDE